MTGLPTTRVYLDDGTGTFPYEVTSRCLLGPGWSLTRGRDDEQSEVSAGTLSLTLNNSDGRFSPGSTIIASPSPIVVDQRIRITETVNGTTYTRFTGYVKAWPVSWPGVVETFSAVQITATDAQARAERRILRSVIEEEILPDSPIAHYTLGEPAGATSAGDSSGAQQPTLTSVDAGSGIVFGNATGPGTDGLTAATFAGGNYLQATLNSDIAAADGALECWFNTTTNDGNVRTILGSGIGLFAWVLSGQLNVRSHVVTGKVDGDWHHLVMNRGSGTIDFYVDGNFEFSTTAGSANQTLTVGGDKYGGPNFIGSIAHVTAYAAPLSPTRVAAHYEAGKADLLAESPSARLFRILGYLGASGGFTGTTDTVVPFKDWTGQSAWEAIQDAVGAEGGLAYVSGNGVLAFLSRDIPVAKTGPDITISAAHVAPDASPTSDDQQIKNYVDVTAEVTGVAQVVRDTASETAHGRYADSKSYLVQTDDEALDRANWIVGNYAEPFTRFGAFTVNLYGMTAAEQAAALANLEPGAWLRVTGLPSQTPGGGGSVDLMVQGISEAQSADAWTLTCNVVARELFEAWVLDDSAQGVLDSTTRLYF